MQESALSPRMLIYGEKELVWDCETRQQSGLQSSYFDPDFYRHLPPEIFSPNGGALNVSKVDAVWGGVLAEFTVRKLSFQEDKLAAVAGIIAELGSVFQDECMFGLWRSNFINQLAWYRRGVPSAVDENTILKCAPEWSWASRVFEIGFLSFGPEDKEDWEIRGREVLLHRRLRKGHDIPAGPSNNWNVYLDFKEPDAENKPYTPQFCFRQNGKEVFYFPLGSGVGNSNSEITMAVVPEGREGIFRRVGIVNNLSGKSWFEHSEKQSIILV